jgi:spore maturation protein CgeB
MGIWELNIACLERVNPNLAQRLAAVQPGDGFRVEPSRQGHPTLVAAGRHLHSAYDPVREGERWAQAQEWPTEEPTVIFGLGLGYHLLPILAVGGEIWVVEPSWEVARLALEHHDLRPLLRRNALRVGQAYDDLPRPARLLAYGPSRRASGRAFQGLEAFLRGQGGKEAGFLRILVVSPLYGGSHPIARYAVRGFQQLGHAAKLLDYAAFYPAYQTLRHWTANPRGSHHLSQGLLKVLGEALLARVREARPDLVFFLAQAPADLAVLRELKREGVVLAYWFVEDWQVFPYWREVAPEVDLFFTLQREPFTQELEKIGVSPAFLPLAADPEVYRPLKLSRQERRRYGSALSFLGAGYANRREFFQGLLDFDFKIWGSEWDNPGPLAPLIQKQGERVGEDEAARVFAASAINLNLHSSPFYPGVNPEGDYLNPRVFDLAAAGAFQLVDWRSQLPEFFQPDREVAVFRSLAEAREQIAYYLAHPRQRRRLALRARRRCLAEHTYKGRMAEALRLLEERHPGLLPRRPSPPPVWEVLGEFLPAGHPLVAWARQAGPHHLTLADLVAQVKAGKDPLTEGEALLWMVHELEQGLKRGRF